MDGNLIGTLETQMAMGIFSGAIKVHFTALAAVKLMCIKTASELAEIIVSVGLAQMVAEKAIRVSRAEEILKEVK
jgi:hydroxymethylglutaryl-CoA reductase